MANFYSVEFVNAAGEATSVTRVFSTLAAARRMAKWLATQAWATKVRIMRDGPGGMEVA